MKRRSFVHALTALAIAVSCTAPTSADTSIQRLQRPAAGSYVVDLAGMLDAAQEQRVQDIASNLHGARQTELFVVTIRSMAEHWPHGDIRIETFAHLLFDQWAIGTAEKNDGILLVVSRDDRKARIQLGAFYRRDYDAPSQVIMNRTIIPAFKRGDFAGGIRAGAMALSQLAQGEPTSPHGAATSGGSSSSRAPAPVVPVRKTSRDWVVVAVIVFVVALVIIVFGVMISAARRSERSRLGFMGETMNGDGTSLATTAGKRSSGAGFWTGFLMGSLTSGRSGSSGSSSGWGGGSSFGGGFGGGGGFSGGGGGGFSGGGGASGGW